MEQPIQHPENGDDTQEEKKLDANAIDSLLYNKNQTEITIVIISDTHGHHSKLSIPNCDILIHCGDLTNFSNMKHLKAFNEWLSTIPIPKDRKLMVTGNHEIKANFELKYGSKIDWKIALNNGILLENEMVELYGINIYGHGWKPDIGKRQWNIPNNANIIITHNPPYGILDGRYEGCKQLKKCINKIKPLIHCFGHVHSDYGIYYDDKNGIYYVNAASVDYQRKPVHEPIVLKITKQIHKFKANKLMIDVLNKDKDMLFKDNKKEFNEGNDHLRFVN
eukprot:105297_1